MSWKKYKEERKEMNQLYSLDQNEKIELIVSRIMKAAKEAEQYRYSRHTWLFSTMNLKRFMVSFLRVTDGSIRVKIVQLIKDDQVALLDKRYKTIDSILTTLDKYCR